MGRLLRLSKDAGRIRAPSRSDVFSLLLAMLACAATPSSALTVAAVRPPIGSHLGGDAVMVFGEGIADANVAVHFDGLPAQKVRVQRLGPGLNSLWCITPAMPDLQNFHNATVIVTNPGGETATLPDAFRFQHWFVFPEVLEDSLQTLVYPAGGTELFFTAYGIPLGPTLRVTLSTTIQGDAYEQQYMGDGFVRTHFKTTSGEPGGGSLRYNHGNNAAGFGVNVDWVSESLPIPASLLPDSALRSGGNVVEIRGWFRTGDTRNYKVYFNGVPATNVKYHRASAYYPARLSCEVPRHAPGIVDVEVVYPNGLRNTLENGFTFLEVPDIRTPEGTLQMAGGDEIAIYANVFNPKAPPSIFFDGKKATKVTVYKTGEYLTAIAPACDEGFVDVLVQVPGHPPQEFPHSMYAVPPGQWGGSLLSSMNPGFGSPYGGTRIQIKTALSVHEEPLIYMGDQLAEDIVHVARPLPNGNLVDDLYFTAPAHAPGPVHITIVDALGQARMYSEDFIYAPYASTVLYANGTNPMAFTRGAAFTDPGATATGSPEGLEGDISYSIATLGEVDPATTGTYRLDYVVGNIFAHTDSFTRTVFVDPPTPARAAIGSDGGIVAHPGCSVEIPWQAMAGSNEVSIRRVQPHWAEQGNLAGDVLPLTAYEVSGLENLLPGEHAIMTLLYGDGDNDGMVDGTNTREEDIRLLALRSPADEAAFPVTVDTENNTVTLLVDESILQTYSGKAPPGPIIFALGGIQSTLPLAPWAPFLTAAAVLLSRELLARRTRRSTKNTKEESHVKAP